MKTRIVFASALVIAGMAGHDFFKPYAVTFDFETMRIFPW